MDIKKIEELINIYPEKGNLPCPVAHFIAAYLGITPLEVGNAATELGVNLYQCQVGLFGYGRKGKSSYKILGRKVEVPETVIDAIKAKARDGRISCIDLWKIADETGVMRPEAGNAADSLGLKITPCQLGAFDKGSKK
ncbi:MAG TPA: hypothetical protein PLU81_00810 [Deltaproteobacteria bacterium]|nr:hypothetical protein [Deltaproteobacteria bacterium]HPJ94811.1 hypothetical protein [Deltaproteobacteria bacterium]HPR50300.1 hypothetical protein [Deltaproteobacteria bacterium]